MPRNSNGVYSLPPGNPVVAGTLIEADWANNTMNDLAAAITASLPRDGTAPMLAPLILSSTTPTQSLEATPKAYVDQVALRGSGMAIGFMAPYSASNVPVGWLKCDGQAVSRLTYSDLFATIGTTYGAGDGSTTFNVPDLRDLFIRGKGASRAVGSLQADALKSHTHAVSDPGHNHTITDPGHSHVITDPGHTHAITDPGHRHTQSAIVAGGPAAGLTAGSNLVQGSTNTGSAATGISIQNGKTGLTEAPAYTGLTEATSQTGIQNAYTGDSETRPANIAFDYYIKALADSSGGGGGGVTAITSSNTNAIGIDATDPAIPQLVVKTNVALGLVALDTGGTIPSTLFSLTASDIANVPAGSITSVDVQGALNELDALKAPSDSPTFIGVSTVSDLNITGTLELMGDPGIAGQILKTQGAGLPPIWGSASSGSIALDIGFTPYKTIAATNVQDAIEELLDETMPYVAPGPAGNSLVSNGLTWESVAGGGGEALPAGTIIDWGGQTVPAGFLECPTVQTNVGRAVYPDLFAAIGTTWGAGDGSTTFGLPYFAAGEAAIAAGTDLIGAASVGQNINHSHNLTGGGVNIVASVSAGGNLQLAGGTGAAAVTNAFSGGTKNLAAGMRVKKCVKYTNAGISGSGVVGEAVNVTFTPADGITATNVQTAIQQVHAMAGGGGRSAAIAMSGLSNHDFAIPAGVNEIEILFRGTSLSGTLQQLVQLGGAGGIQSTGYLASSGYVSTTANNTSGVAFTSGFGILGAIATNIYNCKMTLSRLGDTNDWISTVVGTINGTSSVTGGGGVTMAEDLTTIRVGVNGANTYDAGTVSISWK